MSFAIGIPTLNRADLLSPALLLYDKVFGDVKIYVLDNGKQYTTNYFSKWGIKNVEVIQNDENVGVGKSWNQLCDLIFKEHSHALILNDDIVINFDEKYVSDLIKKYKDNFVRGTKDWCSFIISKKTFNEVGRFDECFYPAYYEDKSYEYRMKLLGKNHIKTPMLNPYVYRSSKTLDKMPSILEASKGNKKLYIKMWGGEPESEKFKTPFNN
jgi:GT2 family glycosyltransferase